MPLLILLKAPESKKSVMATIEFFGQIQIEKWHCDVALHPVLVRKMTEK